MAITRLSGTNAISGTLPAANINNTSIGNVTALPAGVGGKVLQAVQTVKTNRTTFSSSSFIDLTGLSLSITPSSTSSKVLVSFSITHTGVDNYYGFVNLLRNSTILSQGDTDNSNRQECTLPLMCGPQDYTYARAKGLNASFSFLDSPNTTSATTYKIQIKTNSGETIVINGSDQDDQDYGWVYRGVSQINAMEIAG